MSTPARAAKRQQLVLIEENAAVGFRHVEQLTETIRLLVSDGRDSAVAKKQLAEAMDRLDALRAARSALLNELLD